MAVRGFLLQSDWLVFGSLPQLSAGISFEMFSIQFSLVLLGFTHCDSRCDISSVCLKEIKLIMVYQSLKGFCFLALYVLLQYTFSEP